MPIRLYLEESPLEKMKEAGEEKFPWMRIDWKTRKTEQIYPKGLAHGQEETGGFHCSASMLLKNKEQITLDIVSKGFVPSIGHDKAKCYVELWDYNKERTKEIEEYFSPVLDTRESDV